MPTYYLAVDIGASSGRHILGWIEDGRIRLEEIYRFPNGMLDRDGRKFWDIDSLAEHVILGIKKCAEVGKIPSYMGIDTWGVDYVLIDEKGDRLGEAMGYRDARCSEAMPDVESTVPFDELYARTGIQRLDYNTVYQLMADKRERPELLEKADKMLMIPDYLGYVLTGVKEQEYTNATTGALVNVNTGEFDLDLTDKLGYPRKLFGKLAMPGDTLGNLLPEIRERVGFDLTVLHCASHDTASAVIAVPTNVDDAIYLSSGTWSLLGIEIPEPNVSDMSRKYNFTHEGGYNKRIRFLKNIMGLWIIQSIKKNLDDKYSFSELSDMAREYGESFDKIDVNDSRLLSPVNMIEAVKEVMGVPDAPIERVLAAVYCGLADYYAETIRGLSDITGREFSALHIIGGGSRDAYLNELTAERLSVPVYTGPIEATAIGNIACQMLATGVFDKLADARSSVYASFDVNKV